MNKSNKFSPEVRERAVRMVQEHRGEYPSLWAAVESIAPKIGCVPQTLLGWVKRQEIDSGVREGVTTKEAQRVKELEREVKELRRANEILKLPHREPSPMTALRQKPMAEHFSLCPIFGPPARTVPSGWDAYQARPWMPHMGSTGSAPEGQGGRSTAA